MAEGEGFEPSKVSLAGFQDRCTRPLCEPSVGKLTFTTVRAQNLTATTRLFLGDPSWATPV